MTFIVLIGWMYVVLMLAVTQASIWAGIFIVLFLGVLPVWLYACRARRQLQRRRMEQDYVDGSQGDA